MTVEHPGRTGAPGVVPSWADVPAELRSRGLRWTPQRRVLVDVLASTSGHVTGAELVERCREVEPSTTPSTVYRTLDVLEGLGVVRHAHGVDGREEYHVLPAADHGHLYCTACRGTWEIGADELAVLAEALRASRGFRIQLSHVSIAGRCEGCAGEEPGA